MNTPSPADDTHKALGEFVIVFQAIENLYRQIGWFILDPERKEWPPTALRKETNHDLINKVTDLFVGLTDTYAFANGAEKAQDMEELRAHFHALRKYRNQLLHSTYIGLEGGDELLGYIRSDREIGVDSETGELIFDTEVFSADVIHTKMRQYGDFVLRLNLLHVQLLHWTPFAHHGYR